MNKVLVTGGTGFIGSHLVVELVNKGFLPIVVDNFSNSNPKILDGIEKILGLSKGEIIFYNLDVCDANALQKIKSDHPEINSIIHFAAYKAVGESVDKPLMYYKNNLLSIISLLEVFADKKINFVFSSSCTVYGEPDSVPVSEEAPIKKATSPYGNTKQIGEEMLSEFAGKNKINISALRYFNPVGAHPTGLIGELPLGVPNNLIPFITQTAAGWREKIQIFGNDYPTPDGTCIRDYIHVVDLAVAHVAALERMIDGKNKEQFEVYNIGTGKGYSVLEVIQSFEKVNNIKLKYIFAPRREGDVIQVFGDVRKAEKHLNWKAKYGIDYMMETAWKWQKTLEKVEN